MKIKLVISVIALSSVLVGCNNELFKTHTMSDLNEMKERKGYVEEWLDNGKFISNGKNVQILTENGMGHEIVKAAPKGTIFTHYQDIATKKRDGFLPFATTENEAHYLQLTDTACNWLDCDNRDNAELVAKRLVNKIEEVEIQGMQGKHAVIHRATMYDYVEEKWIEHKEEIYLEDMIDTANGLLQFASRYNEPKYEENAHKLLDTVLALQGNIIETQDKNLHGGLYTNLNMNSKEEFVPSYNSYSLALVYELSEIEALVKENQYKPLFNRFKTFMENHLNENIKVSNNLLYVALDGNGDYAKNDIYSFSEDSDVQTEKMFKVIAGIGTWFPNKENLVPHFDVNTLFTTELTDKGNPKLKGTPTILPNVYYLRYLNSTDTNSSFVKDWAMASMGKQKVKGTEEVKGAWLEGVLSHNRNSFEMIQAISEVYMDDKLE